MRKEVLTLGFMLTALLSYGQNTCSFQVRISGNIITQDVILDKIYVPSTACLFDNATFETQEGFYVSSIESNAFSSEFTSHLSPKFCKNSESILAMFSEKSFKFPVRITEKLKDHVGSFKTLEFEIPVEQITFKLGDNGVIEIILPDFK